MPYPPSLRRHLSAAALLAAALPAGANPAIDQAAVSQLVSAVSLDVMSEASLNACGDMGVPSYPQVRAAWIAWRDKHGLAPLRTVVAHMMERNSSSFPKWESITEPMRQKVLADPAPDKACAALAKDWAGPEMDVTALYPQARAVAVALVQAKMASAPRMPAVISAPGGGQVLLPSQVPAFFKQHGYWSAASEEWAQKKLGYIYVKGRVTRNSTHWDHFYLVQEQGDRQADEPIYLRFDAETLVGREVVLRGLVTSLSSSSLTLDGASLVNDGSSFTPYPLAQAPMERKEVILQRVTTAPGKGLPDKDLAAIVIHGQGNYNYGTKWEEDVRFLLRDGTVYRRTEMPPDQLNVAASRQLEPQRWGRWRASGKTYEMQPQDDDGRAGEWKAEKHYAVRPWPNGTRLEGSFSRSAFYGSLVTGGTSSTRGIRFSRDGHFERSYHSLSSSGTLAATLNNTVISGSSSGDGKGSSSTGGGSVGTGTGSAGAYSSSKKDDGASRRGRYQLSGFVLLLDYDDGHQERLLSFPVHEGNTDTVYVGSGSYALDKK